MKQVHMSQDDELARLRARWPEWDVWYVPLYLNGTAWCAKPKGEPVATHNARTPDELEADLRADGSA